MGGIWHQAGCCCEECAVNCKCSEAEWEDLADYGTPCGGYVQEYRIKDYADDLFDACEDCDDAGGGDTPWDGVMPAYRSYRCQWRTYYTSPGHSINGKRFRRALLDATGAWWLLSIECYQTGPGNVALWYGRRLISCYDPLGVYDYYAGCDSGVSSVEIEAVP